MPPFSDARQRRCGRCESVLAPDVPTRPRARDDVAYLMHLRAHGIPLDQFGSPMLALLGAFAIGLLFGTVPAGASEVLALVAGAVQSRSLVFPLLEMLTAGHVAGKLL